jgi:hypothetical protein
VNRAARYLCNDLAHAKPIGKEANMEDFPIWLKALIWLTVGGTVIYVIAAAIYSGMMS